MPLHDFGTVRVYSAEDHVDVFFPKGEEGVKNLLKSMKGRWMPDRRCWRVVPRYIRKNSEEVVAAIENLLLDEAPKGWREALPKISTFTCVTKKYELRVGAGGLRVTLPKGHPCNYAIGKIPGVQKDKDSWLVPSDSTVHPDMKPILTRIVKEDRDLFAESLEFVQRRVITGFLEMSDEDVERHGVQEGAFIFVEPSFLQVVDPNIPNPPTYEQALKISSLKKEKEGLWEASLSYLSDKEAYPLMKKRLVQERDERKPALNLTHASQRWQNKRLRSHS